MSTHHRKLRAARRKLIRSLCCAADERCTQGQYAEAELLYLRALALVELIGGRDHPGGAAICNSLTVFYECVGRFEEAEQL